jgi:hypothetical protein
MHARILRLVLPLALLAAVGGCASASSALGGLTSNPLVSSLTSQLGVSPEQAVGGTGAMLGYAQKALPADQATAVANAIPGASDITKAAAPMLGGSSLSSLADVQSAFSKLGMSPDTVSKFAPILTDQVGKVAGPQVAGLLGGLFK